MGHWQHVDTNSDLCIGIETWATPNKMVFNATYGILDVPYSTKILTLDVNSLYPYKIVKRVKQRKRNEAMFYFLCVVVGAFAGIVVFGIMWYGGLFK